MLDAHRPERRGPPRLRRRFLVHDRTGTGRAARPSIDLSQEGMRLVLQREHLPGTVVEFDLYLGDGPAPLRVRGQVLAARAGVSGVRFVDLSRRDRARLVEALFG
jgi:hypothetical protein